MASTPAVRASLSLAGWVPGSLRVMSVRGREALSQPYRFDLLLLATEDSIPIDGLPGSGCSLTLEVGSSSRTIRGLCWDFELESQGQDGWLYRLGLVPSMEELKLSRQTQIFGGDRDWSLPQIARALLMGQGAVGPGLEAALNLAETDLELRLVRAHPARDFVLQYDESDFDFLSRLLEREGVFYFFEGDETGERLVLSDDSQSLSPVSGGPATLAHRPRRSLARPEELALYDLELESRALPAKVLLTDYNDALPKSDLTTEAQVDPQGHGVVFCAEEHYHSRDEGDALAAVRAAEIASGARLLRGASNAPHLSPGHLFTLVEHPDPAFNDSYLVTAVEHAVDLFTRESKRDAPVYENRFQAIPANAPYAPPRRTARPRIGGLLLAHIGGTRDDRRSEIDDQGRYRVRFAFDLSGRPDGQASCRLRRLQPSGGENAGFHFPLSRGTEVAVGFEKGDPDRPVILGALDNPMTPSVISDRSRLISRIRTAAGSSIEFKDGLTNPGLASDVALALAPAGKGSSGDEGEAGTESTEADLPDTITCLRVYVTDSDHDDQRSYLRMGGYDAQSEARVIDAAFSHLPADERSGLFTMTDGSQITILVGDEEVYVGGNRRVAIVGSGDNPNQTILVGDDGTPTKQTLTVYGDQKVTVHKNYDLTVKNEYSLEVDGTYTLEVEGNTDKIVVKPDREYSYGDKKEIVGGLSTKTYQQTYSSRTYGKKISLLIGGEIKLNATLVQLTRATQFQFSTYYIEQHPIRILRMFWNIKIKGLGKVMRKDLNMKIGLSDIHAAAIKTHQKGFWALY